MKNLDSPTLNSTLCKDMETCSEAGKEKRMNNGYYKKDLHSTVCSILQQVCIYISESLLWRRF